jgi:hypothetical protein
MRICFFMKLSLGAWLTPRNRNLRHEFLFGSLSKSPIVSRAARVYYCIRCKWHFLVCEKRIAALDENGYPLGGAEGYERFKTFGDGPCPALAEINDAALREAAPSAVYQRRRNNNESGHLAAGFVCTWAGRARGMLRVSDRLRENLGDRNDLSHMYRGRPNLRLLSHRNGPT